MIYSKLQETTWRKKNNIAISSSQKKVTFQQLLKMVDRVSAQFSYLGIKEADEALVCLPNSIEFIICFYALAKLKAIMIPINYRSKASEIKLYTKQRLPKMLIAHKTVANRFDYFNANQVKVIIPESKLEPFDNLDFTQCSQVENNQEGRKFTDSDFIVLFSSGSTGHPKKMCRSQESYIYEMNGFIESTNLTSDDSILAAVPLYHSHGIGSCLLPALGSGCQLTLLEDIKDDQPISLAERLAAIFNLIRSEKVTVVPLIPYLFQAMAESDHFTKDYMQSVRLCLSSGNFLSKKVYDTFLKKFNLHILQIYGCSEGGAITINGNPLNNFSWDSSGKPLPHVELMIKKEDGTICAPGEVGEIHIRSKSLITGYINRPVLNPKVFHEGIYISGDLGMIDEKGALILTGRKKLLIDTGGNKVDPYEIEDLLRRYPKVKEAVVLGIESLSGSEIIKAVLTTKSSCTTEEITNYCQKNIAPFKVPKIIEFRNEIPTTPTGKILRKELILSESFTDKMEQLFIRIIYEGLGLDSSTISESPFSNSEIDSLSIVELNYYLTDYFPNLSKTLLFEYQTPEALVNYFQEDHPDIFRQYLKERGISDRKQKTNFVKKHEQKLYQKKEDIAIIGISCVFPGSPDKETFWKNLIEEKDLITEIPKERWDWRDYYGDPTKEPNKSNVKYGGFVEDIDAFDARFFSISAHEAELMDPQQRMLLQNSWHVIEDAGYNPQSCKGRPIGMFVGAMTGDYEELSRNNQILAHTSIGISRAICANRVSYFLGLEGPSTTVDAACASASVAIHQAVSAIQNRECEMALAAAVNAVITPALTISLNQAGMLSQDGRCKSFDRSANGYVRSEGCGVILLKPLSQSINDKDHIYGVIKGSTVNHSGRGRSMTVPNPNAVSRAIIDTHKKSGIPFETINCIEANATGTLLGDPAEFSALRIAYNKLKNKKLIRQKYCGLTSVKANVGHLESASGIAGLIKILLAFKHKAITSNIHFEKLNPNIELEETPYYIIDKTIPWQQIRDKDGKAVPRRAGIVSFGFGGTNSYLLVEEPPAVKSMAEYSNDQLELILLSAQSKEQLLISIKRLDKFLSQQDNVSLKSLAFTLQTGRAHFKHRFACLARTSEELKEQLARIIEMPASNPNCNYWLGVSKKEYKSTEKEITNCSLDEIISSWIDGVWFNFNHWYHKKRPLSVPLPLYPFRNTKFWLPTTKKHLKKAEKFLQKTLTKNEIPINNLKLNEDTTRTRYGENCEQQ